MIAMCFDIFDSQAPSPLYVRSLNNSEKITVIGSIKEGYMIYLIRNLMEAKGNHKLFM
jgi:hypothetical protein